MLWCHVVKFCILAAAYVQQTNCQSCAAREDACLSSVTHNRDYVIGAIVPILPLEDLNTHCNDMTSAIACIDRFIDTCLTSDRNFHRGVKAAYTWLCSAGSLGYRQHAQCFRSVNIHDEGERCTNILERSRGTCSDFNAYINCYHDEVDATCGEDAADWMWDFDYRLLQPRVPSCTLSQGSSSSASVTYSLVTVCVSAAVATFMML